MRKIFLTAMVLMAAIAVSAQSHLDLQSRTLLRRQAIENQNRLSLKKSPLAASMAGNLAKMPKSADAGVGSSDVSLAFVRIEPGFDRSDLEEAGFNVLTVRGDIAIVTVPTDSIEAMASRPEVRKMSLQRPVRAHMDQARKATGIDDIHAGRAIPDVPYTGKNVLTTIVDQGLDPNHPAFIDENGKNRIRFLLNFDGTVDRNNIPNMGIYGDSIFDETFTNMYPPVSRFSTDVVSAYHATHTLNILAGGYKGPVTVADGVDASGTPVTRTIDNPYYGVAPDADIAISTGELQDIFIAYGIDYLLGFAQDLRQYEKKPSVMSLSLGSTAGPHDPNNVMNAFLDICGKESIICLSAGNEGDLKIALNKTFTEADTTMATFVYPYAFGYDAVDQENYYRNGSVLVYSDDPTPFKLRAFIFSRSRNRRISTVDISGEAGDYYVSSADWQNYVGGSINANMARYFQGWLGGGAMLDPDLNRFYGIVDYYTITNQVGLTPDNDEDVIIGFEVIGKPGQRIDCYCDGVNTWMWNYGIDGYMDGSRDGTISDMAVGKNVLVVGAYNTRTDWISLNGNRYGYTDEQGFVKEGIGPYSSYGTLADGRTLPHVCGPGTVISAISRPFINYDSRGNESKIPRLYQAKATVDGKDYYWGVETGTSMSTPFVAGSIALWLEADPSLNIDDVRDIIAQTSIVDDAVKAGNPVQWGAGKFDPVAGLKAVIDRRTQGVQGVVADSDNNRLIFTPAGAGTYDVFVGDADALRIRVFSLTGHCVFNLDTDGNSASIDLSALAPSVYVVSVNGHSKKIAIR